MSANKKSIIYLIASLAIFQLTACSSTSDNSNGDSSTALNDENITLEIFNEILVGIPENSVDKNLTLELIETQSPIVDTDIEVIGKAFHIKQINSLRKLADISIPIPSGESASDLIITKVSESGRLTFLQTAISSDRLSAKTDGFSTLFLSRTSLINHSPLINGPTLLPVGESAIFQETRFSAIRPEALLLEWQVYGPAEIKSQTGHEIIITATDEGRIDIALTATNPETGYRGFSTYTVSSQELTSPSEAEQNNTTADSMVVLLEGGPTTVEFGDPVRLIGKAINAGSELVSWHWSTGSDSVSGDSCNGCGSSFEFPALVYDEQGKYRFSLEAVNINGDEAEVSIEIVVLPKEASLSFSGPLKVDLNDSHFADYSVVVNEPAQTKQCSTYSFKWNISPDVYGREQLHFEGKSEIEAFFPDPGTYLLKLNVSCAGSEFENPTVGNFSSQIEVSGDKSPLRITLNRFATTADVNERLDNEVRVDGGINITAGVKGKYTLTVDWDDGTINTYEISPHSGTQGGFANPQHTYKEEDHYEVKISASDSTGNIASTSVALTVGTPDPVVQDYFITLDFDIPGHPIDFTPDLIVASQLTGNEDILVVAAHEGLDRPPANQNLFSIQIDSRQITGEGTYQFGMSLENLEPPIVTGQAVAIILLNDIKSDTGNSATGFSSQSGTLTITEFDSSSGGQIAGSFNIDISGERTIIVDQNETELETIEGTVSGEFSLTIN